MATVVVGGVRRCAKHNFVISSEDGLFDGTCPRCEYESDMDFLIDSERAVDPEGHDEAMAAYHLAFNPFGTEA